MRLRQFDVFLNRFSDDDKGKILYLMYRVRERIFLSVGEQKKLIDDFKRAVIYLYSKGVVVDEIVKKLSADNLGEFYLKSDERWYPLDNAAKVYPLSMKHRWMAIFRVSAYLNDYVVPELLQMALNFTIKRFPYFATTVKSGIFWHYLDGKNGRYSVSEENSRPVSAMKLGRKNAVPFRVFYYRNRISVEYFHILTDGSGGMIFLKTLVAEYLRLLGKEVSCGKGVFDVNETPDPKEWTNDFLKVAESKDSAGFLAKPARALSGSVTFQKPYRVLHFETDSDKLRALSKEKGVTVTALVLNYIIRALNKSTTGKYDIQAQVPCNMRKIYGSETMRNFSMFGNVVVSDAELSGGDTLKLISKKLKNAIEPKELEKSIVYSNRLVKNIRLIPLFIKSPIVKIVYSFVGDKSFTVTFSNLGLIDMPDNMKSEIVKTDFLLGPTETNRAMCAMSTSGKTAVLAITKVTKDESFENALLDEITADGLEVELKGSMNYEARSKNNLSGN